MNQDWRVAMKKLIKNSILLFMLGFLTAQDCVDDPTYAYDGFGGCETVINTFGMACDASFGGYIVADICPVSCESSARNRVVSYNNSIVNRRIDNRKNFGYSIRCLGD